MGNGVGLANMDIFSRTRAALSAFAAAWSGPGDVRQWPNFIRHIGPTNAGMTIDDYVAQSLSSVWGCVSLLGDSMAQIPLSLVRKDGARRTEVTDHPVAALLARGFNPDLSTPMGIYTGQAQVGITGNAYLRIVRNDFGEPEALYFLDPYATQPALVDNAPYDLVQQYDTSYRGRTYQYAPEDVVHIVGHTTRGVFGVSPITAAREAIGLGLAQEKFGSKFFGNDAKSGGFIIQPADTSARAKRQKQDAMSSGDNDGQGGPDLAHRPKILDPGAKYIPVTISPEDSQFLESRAFQVAEICRFYRVPLVFMDSSAATAWGSGIEHLKIGFVELTINPLASRWTGELSRKLLTDKERAQGLRVEMNPAVLLRGDMAARGEYINKRILNGSLTRNEARGMEGDNPLDGLDIPLMPVNMQDGRNPPTNEQPKDDKEGNDDADDSETE